MGSRTARVGHAQAGERRDALHRPKGCSRGHSQLRNPGQNRGHGNSSTDGIIESRSPDRIIFLGGAGSIVIRNLTTGQTLTITPNQWIMATPNQPMRTGPVTDIMRRQLAPFYQVTQSFVPGTVSNPDRRPRLCWSSCDRWGFLFGEPQFSNSNQGETPLPREPRQQRWVVAIPCRSARPLIPR